MIHHLDIDNWEDGERYIIWTLEKRDIVQTPEVQQAHLREVYAILEEVKRTQPYAFLRFKEMASLYLSDGNLARKGEGIIHTIFYIEPWKMYGGRVCAIPRDKEMWPDDANA